MIAKEEKRQILKNTRLFSAAPEAVLSHIVDALEVVTIKSGETLFEKGDLGTSMYIIADGQVYAHDGDLYFNSLGKGDVFGEMAALDRDVRSASITAMVDTTLFQLQQQSLYEIMSDQIEVTREIIHVLCQRLRENMHDWAEDFQQRKVLERELEIGREIQNSFLPGTLPQPPGWEIAAHFQAAREVAGDFYDAFVLPKEKKIGLVIGDVADKGVGAALFMTLFRSLIRATATSDYFRGHSRPLPTASNSSPEHQETSFDDSTCLSNCINLTNNYIASTHGQTSMFASVFLAFLNPDTGSLQYVNGGHEAPIVFNQNGVKTYLDSTGPAVGLIPNIKFKIQEVSLDPGDTLLAFTDGVTEAKNSQGDLFTKERLVSLLGQADLSASALLQNIEKNLIVHTTNADKFDDITMLAVKRRVTG